MMATRLLEKRKKLHTNSETLNIVTNWIDDVCNEFKVEEEYYGNILIAVTEAVNNAINHGNKNNSDKSIYLSCQENENGSLSFQIEDEGKGFDYDSLPDPTLPENLEKVNGRGVFLMKNLADEVSFSEEGKIVELIFNVK